MKALKGIIMEGLTLKEALLAVSAKDTSHTMKIGRLNRFGLYDVIYKEYHCEDTEDEYFILVHRYFGSKMFDGQKPASKPNVREYEISIDAFLNPTEDYILYDDGVAYSPNRGR